MAHNDESLIGGVTIAFPPDCTDIQTQIRGVKTLDNKGECVRICAMVSYTIDRRENLKQHGTGEKMKFTYGGKPVARTKNCTLIRTGGRIGLEVIANRGGGNKPDA